nr:MAG TPA: Putative tail length tape measure protein [Caudoviricetes sp.]
MAQDLVTNIRLDDKQFMSIIEKVKSEVGDTSSQFTAASGNIKKELKSIQGELANMLLNGVDPSTQKFQELAARAGSIKDAMGDARSVVSDFSNDVRGLAGVTNLATTGISVFQTFAGSLAMFGVESDQAQETLQKLAGAMSLLSGITKLQSTFMDQSTTTYRAYHALLRLVGVEQSNNSATVTANTVAVKANEVGREANSAALQASTGAIQGNTGALTASTTSTVANTTATTASATATTGLSVAQKVAAVSSKALKIALASIGIGLVISLVASLVAHWEDIVGWFKRTFPELNKLGGAFNKLKQVVYGVGNAVLQYIVTPFRIAGSVIKDLINGNYEGLVQNAMNAWKKGADFAKNYQVGSSREAANQRVKAAEEANKKILAGEESTYKKQTARYGQSAKRDIKYYSNRLKYLKKGTKEYEEAELALMSALHRQDEERAAAGRKSAAGRTKAGRKSAAGAKKAAEKAKRELEKIADDQKTVKQTLETETVTNNKGSRKVEEDQLKSAYESDKGNEINTQAALDNQYKIIGNYYEGLEKFRQKDYADAVAAETKKYDALTEKAHGNKELITQIEEQKQAALANIQAEYNNKYNELLDQRAKDEKEASDKLLQPYIDKAEQLGQALGRSLNLKGLDFSALKTLTGELQKSVDSMKELQKVKDSLSGFESSGINQMISDVIKLKDVLGSDQADAAQKLGASLAFVGETMQQLGAQSEAAKAGMVLAAIGQIILGFSTASAQAAEQGPWVWIAATIAGLAVMTSTIAQLQSFSQGGIVGGSSFTGDSQICRVNSGEFVMTKTQQGNLFRLLDNNTAGLGGGVGVSSVRIKGSDLYLALSNYSKVQSKTGRHIL